MKELETDRLKLRFLKPDDSQTIFKGWASDPQVTKYVTWTAHEDVAVTKAVLEHWLEEYKNDNCYRYGIERKSDGVLMGMIDVVGFHHDNPVIGYSLGREYWNNGYMTEAFRAVIAELFSQGYKTLVVEAAKDNIGSNRVIQKCGFTLVATREEAISETKPEIMTINSYRLSR